MFFEIKKSSDSTFSNSHNIVRDIWLNCDDGWKITDLGVARIYSKGYVEHCAMDQQFFIELINSPEPKFCGNFLAIIVNADGEITITHDVHRGTPMAVSRNPWLITNLLRDSTELVWADRYVKVNPVGLIIDDLYFNPYGDFDFEPQSRQQVVQWLHRYIDGKFQQFLSHNHEPIKVFLSGGIDTLCLFSFLKRHTDNFEIVNYEHVDFTKTYCNKKHLIDQYWGYKQIHLWSKPTVLLTGANGDENLLRSPGTINLLLMHYGLDIFDLIGPENYHYKYLTADKLKPLYEKQRMDPDMWELTQDYQKLCEQILNINLHDHQHWHFDNTLTLTPFKDLELLKRMLKLPQEDQIDQIMNAGISKELLSMNDESLLEGLSNRKNQNTQENLYKIYEKYKNNTRTS